jgi:AraC-like DNA-binding protein
MERVAVTKVIHLLLDQLEEIKTVEDWAFSAGYSKSYFVRLIRAHYRQTPEMILRWVRMMKIAREFHENPDKICYAIALDTGLNNDNGLCYFVKRHMGVTPGMLRTMMEESFRYEELLEATSQELGLPLMKFPELQPIRHETPMVA